MAVAPHKVKEYLTKRSFSGPWQLAGQRRGGFHGAIVIPSLAEGDSLFKTLDSLRQNPPEIKNRFLTVVVVNAHSKTPCSDFAQNHADLNRLSQQDQATLPLAWIDATSPGVTLTDKFGGVGLARKIGMDLALVRLDWSVQPILISLDADTLVDTNYLTCLANHFKSHQSGGAVLAYRHQSAENQEQQLAIDTYELFLRSYVLGLSLAKSPYAFATIGSAMACKAMAYVQCGGMSTRKAAEDFYFLDKLSKTSGISECYGTIVAPSPRPSGRVPFGTGQSVANQLLDRDQPFVFYPSSPFKILGAWLTAVSRHVDEKAESIFAEALTIAPELARFLQQAGWQKTWTNLCRNHAQLDKRLHAFHCWFDSLKTLRLIHHLCATVHPKAEAELALPELFKWAKLACPQGIAAKLAVLRHSQQVYK